MSSASEALPAAVIPQRAPEVIDVDLETEPAATDEIAQPTNTSDMNDVSEAESPRCKSATIIARRVTLDPTEDTVQADDESDSHCSSPFTVDPKQNSFPAVCDRNDAPAAAQFDLYDDFMSPKKNDDDSNACLSDEIVDSSPEVCIVDPPARVRRPPQASFGPAKTLRFRFGPPPAAGRPSQASKSGRSSTTAKPIARPLTMLRMSTSPRNMQTKLHSHYFSRKK